MQNFAFVAGNMGQDPETRTTSGGKKITYFSLATSRTKYVDGKPVKDDQGRRVQETEWHRITCFSGLGAIVEKYCSKGMKVSVRGRLHYSKWTDKDGNDRNGCEIVAEESLLHAQWLEAQKFYGDFHRLLLESGVRIFEVRSTSSFLEKAIAPPPLP